MVGDGFLHSISFWTYFSLVSYQKDYLFDGGTKVLRIPMTASKNTVDPAEFLKMALRNLSCVYSFHREIAE